MSMPIAYRKRVVNPSWIHYWNLAHKDHKDSIFVGSFITPDPYIDSDKISILYIQ